MMWSNKLRFLVVVSVISFIDCDAQVNVNPQNKERTASVQYIYSLDQLISPREYPIEGTPYFIEAYSKGNMYSQKGNFSYAKMRYNIFYDRMEFEERGSLHAIDPDLLINKIVLGTQTFIVDNHKLKGKTIPTYFLRLDSGSVTLMTKMTVTFRDRQQGKPIEGDIPAEYQRRPDIYYFKYGNGPLIKVRSIKKLIDELPDRKQEMEEFARNEKISANKAEELTRLIQYYNSLK